MAVVGAGVEGRGIDAVNESQNVVADEKTVDQGAKALVVDVTAVSGQSFFTGVQRIVREFCDEHRKDLLFVKYDPKYQVFRVVPRLSRLRYRVTTGFWGHLRVWLKNLYWNASKDFREAGKNRMWIPGWVRKWAKAFYEALLSDTVLEKESAFHKRPVWNPAPHQTFILLDIPVSNPHITGLLGVMESHEVRTVIYVHDLFPLTHRSIFNKRSHAGVRAKHLRYLDVVSSADEVVCNSEFTLEQYSRYVSMFEDASAQTKRVVYPPWPQFSARAHGSTEDVANVFEDAAVRILAVGGLDKRKNFVVLLEALDLLVADGVDARLVLVSGATAQVDPIFKATMLALSDEAKKRVDIIRQVSDDRLVEIYSRATVVAVPSLAEGFGLPVVEALSRQRPVVAAKTTALVELARHLPVALADPHKPEQWRQQLVETSEKGLADDFSPSDVFPADWSAFRARLLAER